jgi:hypothetical protein
LTRKLIALDLLLLAVLAWLAFAARREWLAAKARERAFQQKVVKPTPAQPLTPFAKPAPLMASVYVTVAQMNLFSQDRNSNVILDPPVPVKEKPVPPFPVARGVMLWEGVPPTVVLSDRSGGAQKGYHPGETIGEWKIVSVDNQYVVFEWDGKQFQKRLDELLDKTALVTEAATPQSSAAANNLTPSSAVQSLSTGRTEGPGASMGEGIKGCVAGDTAPPGTVADGMRKVVSATPFGSVCRWESIH